MGIIYLVENKINGKFYVGKTKRNLKKRKKEHENYYKHSLLSKAICKYGKENFKWNTIDKSNNENTLKVLEMKYIKQFESLSTQWGYNQTINKVEEKINKPNKRIKRISETRLNKWFGSRRDRTLNPETRCWQTYIFYNQHRTYLGLFEDPYTALLVRDLVWKEIFGEYK